MGEASVFFIKEIIQSPLINGSKNIVNIMLEYIESSYQYINPIDNLNFFLNKLDVELFKIKMKDDQTMYQLFITLLCIYDDWKDHKLTNQIINVINWNILETMLDQRIVSRSCGISLFKLLIIKLSLNFNIKVLNDILSQNDNALASDKIEYMVNIHPILSESIIEKHLFSPNLHVIYKIEKLSRLYGTKYLNIHYNNEFIVKEAILCPHINTKHLIPRLMMSAAVSGNIELFNLIVKLTLVSSEHYAKCLSILNDFN
jgi:hypothetical protein